MLIFKNQVSLARGDVSVVALRSFWDPENGFVWSRGKWCDVTFDFDFGGDPAGGLAELILDIDVCMAPDHRVGQSVWIYLNGARIGSNVVERRLTSIREFDARTLRAVDNVLTLETPDAVQPGTFGLSDTRQLGVRVFSLQVRAVR